MNAEMTRASSPAPSRYAAEGARKPEASRQAAQEASQHGQPNSFLSLLAAFGAQEAVAEEDLNLRAGTAVVQPASAPGGEAADLTTDLATDLATDLTTGLRTNPLTDSVGAGKVDVVTNRPVETVDETSASLSGEMAALLLAGQMLQGRTNQGDAMPGVSAQGEGAETNASPVRLPGRGMRAGAGMTAALTASKDSARLAVQDGQRHAFGLAVAMAAQAQDGQPGLRLGQAGGLLPIGPGGAADGAPAARGAGHLELGGIKMSELMPVSSGASVAGERQGGDSAGGASQHGSAASTPGSGGVATLGDVAGAVGEVAFDNSPAGGDVSVYSPEEQIAEQVRYWISDDVQNAELTLDPWGTPVEVAISLTGKEAHVSFRTDGQDVRRLLEDSVAHLRELLQREGLALGGVSVGSSGTDGQGAREREAASSARSGIRRATVSVAADSAVASRTRATLTSGRTVDMFV